MVNDLQLRLGGSLYLLLEFLKLRVQRIGSKEIIYIYK